MMMSSPPGMMAATGVVAIVSSLSLPSIAFFEVVWIIGMAAMMFPAMIPMVFFYDKIKTKVESNPRLAKILGTPLFLAGYLATYALFGLAAYLAVYFAISLSSALPVLASLSVAASATILIGTGLYQFSSLKTRCMSNCVSPLGFFTAHSYGGLTGAFRMGFSHGKFCTVCCSAYMLVMLAVGAMSIPVMLALTGVIALEKVIIRGATWFNRIIAVAFILLGILVLLFPSLLSAIQTL